MVPSVLVLDDDPDLLRMTRAMLQSLGVRAVYTAGGAYEALNIILSTSVNLIITDIEMKPIDGLSFVARVRADCPEPIRNVPIIATSGLTDPSLASKAIVAGAGSFLPKPFRREELASAIQSLLDRGPAL